MAHISTFVLHKCVVSQSSQQFLHLKIRLDLSVSVEGNAISWFRNL